MSDQLHPLAPHHLPGFITAPGETDVWMVVMGVFLIVAVLAVGNFYLQLHSLPERMAHKSQKLQFETPCWGSWRSSPIYTCSGSSCFACDLPDFSTPCAASQVRREDRCIVNAYTSNHELISSGKLSTAKSFGLHAVDAVGLVHALLLRIQALLLPIKTLVLSGH